MRRMIRVIATEVLPVLLVLASLAGAWLVIVTTYRHQSTPPPSEPVEIPTPLMAVQILDEEPDSTPVPSPAESPEPRPDPTPAILAALEGDEQAQQNAARAAERRIVALSKARELASTRAATLKRREMIVTNQASALEKHGQAIEIQTDRLAHVRDILVKERDDLKEAVTRARSRDGYAVLPYKGANGTWRRPIPIECRNGTATIQPGGPSFSLLELSLGFGRSNPLTAVLARYINHIENGPSPDGAPVVPYVLFVVRPDGIRPYYEARTLLEPLGITFGYELVEQDVEIEFPDLDDPAEWSEVPPLPSRFARGAGWPLTPEALDALQAREDGSSSIWPTTRGAQSNRSTGDAGGMTSRQVEVGGTREGLGTPPTMFGGTAERSNGLNRPTFGGGSGPGENSGFSPDGFLAPNGDARGIGLGSGTVARGEPEPERGASRDEGPRSSSRLANTTIPHSAPWPPVSHALLGSALDRQQAGERGGFPGGIPDNRSAGGEGGSGAASTTLEALQGSEHMASSDGRGAGSNAMGGAGNGGNGGGGGMSGSPILPEPVLDLVVVCRLDGVLIQPGGYRISQANLGDDRVVNTLRAIVNNRQALRADVRWRPRIKFLVEPGGQPSYWSVRRQTALAGLGWPVWLEVAEGTVPGRLFDPEVLR